MSEKKMPLLLTPGPVEVPDFVRTALASRAMYPRSRAFRTFFAETQPLLQYFLQTIHPVLTVTGTGTVGVEMAMRSLFSSGDRVLVVSMGKFSERWVTTGRLLGQDVTELVSEYGKAPSPDELMKACEGKNLTGVVLTHCETSTGAYIDMEECALRLRAAFPELLIVADCISTAGAMPLYTDRWSLDAVITASQKALMNPAGLAFVSLSDRASMAVEKNQQMISAHLWPYLKSHREGDYPYTSPVHLLMGVRAALESIHGETLPARWNRVRALARYTRTQLMECGAGIFPEIPADSLTVFRTPGRDAESIRYRLQDEFGLQIAGGQGSLKGEVLRVGHFGAVTERHMELFTGAMRIICN